MRCPHFSCPIRWNVPCLIISAWPSNIDRFAQVITPTLDSAEIRKNALKQIG